MKWRIGEIADPCNPTFDPDKRRKYEIDIVWESEEITAFNSSITIPASFVEPGHTYRVRCRMMDNTNRWSHWSDPNEFTTSEPLPTDLLDNLRITEIMYHPADGPGFLNNEFDFIELKNTGTAVLDLNNVSFIKGVKVFLLCNVFVVQVFLLCGDRRRDRENEYNKNDQYSSKLFHLIDLH